MSLWLHDCASGRIDPHFAAHELPVAHHAKACYEGWIPADTLQTAFDQACETLKEAKNKWNRQEVLYRPPPHGQAHRVDLAKRH